MTAPADDDPPVLEPASPVHASRGQLIWDLIRFQLKLMVDGLVDLILSPLAWLAVILGLLAGGDDPHRYFRQLLRLGRRIEVWLNLFGVYRRRGTADAVMDEWRERVFGEPRAEEWLRRASGRMNSHLDAVNRRRSATRPSSMDDAAASAPPDDDRPPTG